MARPRRTAWRWTSWPASCSPPTPWIAPTCRPPGSRRTPARSALRVTHAVAAKSADFRFAQPWKGLETLPRAGDLIGWSEGEPVVAPYDDCVLIMPSTANLRRA